MAAPYPINTWLGEVRQFLDEFPAIERDTAQHRSHIDARQANRIDKAAQQLLDALRRVTGGLSTGLPSLRCPQCAAETEPKP